jgi:subtilase family serine protease
MRTSHIFCALPVALLLAQTDRTIGPLEISRTVRLPGHLHPLAQPRFEQGRVAAESPIGPVILSLAKTPAQQAELEKLLQAQQDQSSPNYRHWLTPEQHSNILVSDIGAFRSMFGLPASDPQVVVYGPDPGLSSGQGEATGDIEAAMGVARNATIVLVVSTSALHSVAHAVDDALAPVIGLSSGSYESLVSASQPLPCRAIAQQATAEGITWVTGSSDSGATACEAKGATPLAGHGLAIGFPAGIPEVTATGGT